MGRLQEEEDDADDNKEEFGIDYAELDGFTVRHLPVPSTLWGPQSTPSLFPRGMYAKNGKLARAGKLLAEGKSYRQIQTAVGMSMNTIGKLARVLRQVVGLHVNCKCGQPSGHRGWCWWRVSQSERRQAFLKRWHTEGGVDRHAAITAALEHGDVSIRTGRDKHRLEPVLNHGRKSGTWTTRTSSRASGPSTYLRSGGSQPKPQAE